MTAEAIQFLLEKIRGLGPWADLLYSVAVAVSVVFLLPGGVLTLGGGFLFGTLKGIYLFVAAETLGASLAFAVARKWFGPGMERRFRRHPKWKILDESMRSEGWRFILLTRMVPFFPYKLSNYFFGMSGVRFRDFFWGTLLGTLPLSFTMIYLGSLASDLASLSRNHGMGSPLSLGVSAGSGAAALAGLFLISKRALRAYESKIAGTAGEGLPGSMAAQEYRNKVES